MCVYYEPLRCRTGPGESQIIILEYQRPRPENVNEFRGTADIPRWTYNRRLNGHPYYTTLQIYMYEIHRIASATLYDLLITFLRI